MNTTKHLWIIHNGTEEYCQTTTILAKNKNDFVNYLRTHLDDEKIYDIFHTLVASFNADNINVNDINNPLIKELIPFFLEKGKLDFHISTDEKNLKFKNFLKEKLDGMTAKFICDNLDNYALDQNSRPRWIHLERKKQEEIIVA